MTDDKRRHTRFEIQQMVDVAFPRETFFHADGVNISEGGMLCKTNYDIEPLSQIFCMVRVKCSTGECLIKTRGTVIHAQREGDEVRFGVSFDELDETDRKLLRDYVQELQPHKGDE